MPENHVVTNGYVRAIEADDDTVWIAGSFDVAGRKTGSGAPVDLATGELVSPFPEVTGLIWDAVPDGVGGWYIGGVFTEVGGVTRRYLARILADGSVSAWNPQLDLSVFRLSYDENTLYVSGNFTMIDGQARNHLAAFDGATGALLPWEPKLNPDR